MNLHTQSGYQSDNGNNGNEPLENVQRPTEEMIFQICTLVQSLKVSFDFGVVGVGNVTSMMGHVVSSS